MPKFCFSPNKLLISSLVVLAGCAAAPEQKQAGVPHVENTPQVYSTMPEGMFADILSAEIALRRNALNQALPLFAKTAHQSQSPQLAETTAKLADFLGNADLAQSATSIWLHNDPDNAEAISIKAKALLNAGKLMSAFEFINANAAKEHDELLVKLASKALSAERAQHELIYTVYSKALAESPEQIGLLLGMGLLTERKDQTKAYGYIDQASIVAPESAMVANIKAAVEIEHGKYQQAIDTLDQALQYQPEHYGLMRHRAAALLELDIMQAKSAYESLYELSPSDPKVLYPLTQINMKLEFYDEATVHLKALANYTEYSDYASYSLGLIAESGREHFIAMNHYADVQAKPYLYPALRRYERLALALSGDADFEEHLKSLEGSARGDEKINLIVHRAEFLLRNKQTDKAGTLVHSALGDHPENNKLLYALFLAEQQSGNYLKAVKPLEKMLSKHPENPTLLNALGYTLSRYLGDHDRAKTLIIDAHSLAPDDPAIIDSMGWISMQFGELNTALSYFNKAYELSENADIAVHIGEVLWRQNNRQQAIKWLQKVWQTDQYNEELQDTLNRLQIELQ